MAEENNGQNSTENVNQHDDNLENSEVPTFTTFISNEVPQIKQVETNIRNNKEMASIKFWLILLCVFFCGSMLSGIYLISNNGVAISQPTGQRSEGKEKSKSFFKNSAKEGAAVIKIRGVISESSDSNAFSSKQNASTIANRIRVILYNSVQNYTRFSCKESGGFDIITP